MSIATMTRLVSSTPAASARRGVAPPAGQAIQETALEKITAFIPTEVIGIYVAGLGIFSTSANGEGAGGGLIMTVFSICLALVPVFVAVNVQLRNRTAPAAAQVNKRKAILMVIFGVVAYVAWVCALPESPFADSHPQATQIGAFAVVVLGLLMPGVAQLLGLVPKS